MKTEMTSLAYVTALTATLWIPYVLNRLFVGGFINTIAYPTVNVPLSLWAQRLRAAHHNAIENLAVFAPLVLASQMMGISTPITALACTIFLWSRIVHVIAYTCAIPGVRTLAFVGGFIAQLLLFWQLYTRALTA